MTEKNVFTSPYVFCSANPIVRVDPDGRNSYLLVWFSADGETGHAGIAVDNYKPQPMTDSNGNPILDKEGNPLYEMVKDGTMTYYDLWPKDQVKPSELQSDVPSDYSKGVLIDNITDLTQNDPTCHRSGNVSPEGRAPDGVVQLETSYTQDMKVKDYASKTANSGKSYNACHFNCSTFSAQALKKAFPKLNASQYVRIPFPLSIKYSDEWVVAPNNLFNAAMRLPGATNISGPKSVIAKPYLEYYGK